MSSGSGSSIDVPFGSRRIGFSKRNFLTFVTRWHIIASTHFFDFSIIVLTAAFVYPLIGLAGEVPLRYISGAAVVAIICQFSFVQGRLYEIDALLDEVGSIKSIAVRWTVIFMALAALGALSHQQTLYSRLWIAAFFAAGLAALAVERALIALVIRSWIARGYTTRTVAVVGCNDLADQLMTRFEKNGQGTRVVGLFDDREGLADQHWKKFDHVGTIADLIAFAQTREVDIVVLTLPLAATERVSHVIQQLRQLPVKVGILPGALGLERISPIRLGRTDLPGVQLISVQDPPISEIALFTKGSFDRIAAALGLIFIAPLLLCCAIGIMLSSPGPIFFRQKRTGYKGREFDIFKFRTMHVTDRPNTELTQRQDRRVFKFGGLLRRLSFDELPQLINVLRGDMSLVGPRPHMPQARAAGMLYFEAVDEYAWRHRVKPGITGWAQMNGWRGPTETLEQIERRVEHDIYYIENWSLLLDVVILFKTALVGFFGKNAF